MRPPFSTFAAPEACSIHCKLRRKQSAIELPSAVLVDDYYSVPFSIKTSPFRPLHTERGIVGGLGTAREMRARGRVRTMVEADRLVLRRFHLSCRGALRYVMRCHRI